MSRKINVNILNHGNFMGLKTPVYNYPMDYDTFVLLKEMGFMIEQYIPKTVEIQQPIVEPVTTTSEESVIQTENTIEVRDSVVIKPTTTIVDETKPDAVEEWMTKPYYTEEELEQYSKNDLIKILNYRGHYSSKTGTRDAFAPKFDDNKTVIRNKILKTNKNI